MAEKQEKQQDFKVLVYTGPTLSIPEKGLMLTFGKTYTSIPQIPKELSFLKSFFIPLESYTQKKKEMMMKHREALERVKEVMK